jgi:hypothetical protein
MRKNPDKFRKFNAQIHDSLREGDQRQKDRR